LATEIIKNLTHNLKLGLRNLMSLICTFDLERFFVLARNQVSNHYSAARDQELFYS